MPFYMATCVTVLLCISFLEVFNVLWFRNKSLWSSEFKEVRRPQSRLKSQMQCRQRLWARIAQLSSFQTPDPQKLWHNKCLSSSNRQTKKSSVFHHYLIYTFQIYIQIPSLWFLTTICIYSSIFPYFPLTHFRFWSMTDTFVIPSPILVMLLCLQLHPGDIFILPLTCWNPQHFSVSHVAFFTLLFSLVTCKHDLFHHHSKIVVCRVSVFLFLFFLFFFFNLMLR